MCRAADGFTGIGWVVQGSLAGVLWPLLAVAVAVTGMATTWSDALRAGGIAAVALAAIEGFWLMFAHHRGKAGHLWAGMQCVPLLIADLVGDMLRHLSRGGTPRSR